MELSGWAQVWQGELLVRPSPVKKQESSRVGQDGTGARPLGQAAAKGGYLQSRWGQGVGYCRKMGSADGKLQGPGKSTSADRRAKEPPEKEAKGSLEKGR